MRATRREGERSAGGAGPAVGAGPAGGVGAVRAPAAAWLQGGGAWGVASARSGGGALK